MFPSLHPNALRRTHHNQQDNRGKGQQMRQTRKTQAPTENERRADDAQDAMIRFAWRTGLDINLNRNADGPETVLVDLLANNRRRAGCDD